jgi:serine/threonine protein kinase
MILQIRHPHLCQIHKYAEDIDGIYLVYEYLNNGRNLYQYLKCTNLTMKNKIKILKQIASAILELHSKNIVHNNINSKNIFVICEDNFKLGEYGSWTNLNIIPNTPSTEFKFIPPEILKKGKPSLKSDIFNFGVLMWLILSNILSSGEKITEISDKPDISLILENENDKININIIRIMSRTLKANPNERPEMKEILESLLNMNI